MKYIAQVQHDTPQRHCDERRGRRGYSTYSTLFRFHQNKFFVKTLVLCIIRPRPSHYHKDILIRDYRVLCKQLKTIYHALDV